MHFKVKDTPKPGIKPTAGYFKKTDRVLIVGGTGFIGRHVARRCLSDTPFVTCLGFSGKTHGETAEKEIEFIRADLVDRQKLHAVISKRRFDYVLNLGGYIDHASYFKGGRRVIAAHFEGLLNLIDCLDTEGLKAFVQIGSSDEYGNAPAPQKESMRESPISSYSFAKTAASHFMQTLSNTEGFPGVVLRFFLVYGPGQDDKRFLPQIIKACLRNKEFKTSEGKQIRDFCYVDDVVSGIMKAAICPEARGRVINIASGIPVSVRSVVEKVMELTGGGKPLWGSYPCRTGENMNLFADICLSKKFLDWEPQTSLEEGLVKTIDYYRGIPD